MALLRLLIADDHAIVRKGLRQLLLEIYPTAYIGEAGDAESLMGSVLKEDWDVVICDINMPGRSGLDALAQLKQAKPAMPVLIMSMYPEDQYAVRVLRSGASGYLAKDSIHDDIGKAVELVVQGKKFITPSVAEKLAEAVDTLNVQNVHELLSDREFDVFKLLAAGNTITDIAEQLSLGATTVSTYRSRIMEKMNMRTNADLTRYAIERKLI